MEAAQIDLQIREQLTIIRQHQQTVNQLRQRKRELTAAHSNLGDLLLSIGQCIGQKEKMKENNHGIICFSRK